MLKTMCQEGQGPKQGEHCRVGIRVLQAAFPEEVGTGPGQAHGIECSRTPRQ